MSVFLSAQWRRLALVTYVVPPAVLEPYLPAGLVLDCRAGQAFVSFVAFQFLETRVKGLAIPGHVNFPEINLRFYVRQGERRGVCFIRELVPRYCIALIARRLYNEPYLSAPMTMDVTEQNGLVCATYTVQMGNRLHTLRIQAANQPVLPPPDSTEHFFKEHEWGFGQNRTRQTQVYRVAHPVWRAYPNPQYELDVDFAALYGEAWRFLNYAQPYNVAFAEGSDIQVFGLEK